MKRARRNRDKFVTTEGLLVEAKTTGPDCGCHKNCMIHFVPERKQDIIKTVYSGHQKNEQDTCLLGLISRYDVTRHCAVSEYSTQNMSSNKYFATQGTNRIEVCRKAYMPFLTKLFTVCQI